MIPYRGDLNVRAARGSDPNTLHARQVQSQVGNNAAYGQPMSPQTGIRPPSVLQPAQPGAVAPVAGLAAPQPQPMMVNTPAPGVVPGAFGQQAVGPVRAGQSNPVAMGAPVLPLQSGQMKP